MSNPLYSFIRGTPVYYDRTDLCYKLVESSVAINPQHIVEIAPSDVKIEGMHCHPKVYSILSVGGTYHLIMSENIQLFMGDL